jgi:chemotaxis protein methyltransferase CheR
MIEPLRTEEFHKIRELLVHSCGIDLDDDKEYLVESRLTDFGNEIGASSFGDLHNKILADKSSLLPRVIDLMTTNETFWFRDDSAWTALAEEIIPNYVEMLQTGKKSRIRIWSAASSTGQEAYSLSMLIKETCEAKGQPSLFNSFEILGTDISNEALYLAKAAKYNIINVKRGLSPERLEKYFTKDGRSFALNTQIQSITEFKFFNLLDPFDTLGSFDMVLCRNVAIYFSGDFKKKLFSKIHSTINEDGLLMLGASESLFGYSTDFETVEHSSAIYYRKKG